MVAVVISSLIRCAFQLWLRRLVGGSWRFAACCWSRARRWRSPTEEASSRCSAPSDRDTGRLVEGFPSDLTDNTPLPVMKWLGSFSDRGPPSHARRWCQPGGQAGSNSSDDGRFRGTPGDCWVLTGSRWNNILYEYASTIINAVY